MSDLMREEFEIAFVARCKKKGEVARLDRFDDGRYEYLDASDAWWGWKASRECLVIKLPETKEIMPLASDMCVREMRKIVDENKYTRAIDLARRSIHAAGVKTK